MSRYEHLVVMCSSNIGPSRYFAKTNCPTVREEKSGDDQSPAPCPGWHGNRVISFSVKITLNSKP